MSVTTTAVDQSAPVSQTLKGLRYWTWWLPVFAIIWLIVLFTAFSNPVNLIEENWPLIIVGFLGAVIGNATAVGGGVVFIPIMILVYQLPAIISLKLALGSQSFGMTSGAIGWLKRGAVSRRMLTVAVPSLLVGSSLSTLIFHPNTFVIKGLFGPASIFIGLVILLTINRKGFVDEVPSKALLPLGIVALIGGFITGWVAIGEGEVVAAFLMLVYGLRAERGIGLGVVLLAVNSLYLTFLHEFFAGGIPWEMVMFTGFGCVFGGRLGPYLSQWLGPHRLKIGFAAIAIIDGAIFIFQFLTNGIK